MNCGNTIFQKNSIFWSDKLSLKTLSLILWFSLLTDQILSKSLAITDKQLLFSIISWPSSVLQLALNPHNVNFFTYSRQRKLLKPNGKSCMTCSNKFSGNIKKSLLNSILHDLDGYICDQKSQLNSELHNSDGKICNQK